MQAVLPNPREVDGWPAGVVVLAGAGPGDPELMTLRAARRLADAEIVLHDALIDPRVLSMARGRLVDVGKRCGRHRLTQEQINRELVAAAQTGARVLRLKGGDPMVFGRAAEEIAALRAAGFVPEVIPGVTAATAAAAAVSTSLTLRGVARSVTFVTGHDQDGALPAQDWRALAAAGGTLVFYMAARHARAIADRLIEAGLDPAIPALAASGVARAGQALRPCRLVDLADALEAEDHVRPCVILIGLAMAIPGHAAARAVNRPQPVVRPARRQARG